MMTPLVFALLAALPQGQQADDRWLAFEGCWTVADASTTTAAPVVCIVQAAEGAVFRTYLNGVRQTERTVVADEVARPVSESGCTGTERARWSADGRRVFIQSDLACTRSTSRTSSTVLAFVNAESFVDVQAVRVAGEAAVRSIRYRAVPSSQYPADFQLAGGNELARETARLHASAALDIDDVVEASRVLYPDAVNALLSSRRAGFALDGELLKQLRAQGVASSTVDVMVALTYPERFAVADEERAAEPRSRWSPRYGWEDPYYGGYGRYGWYDPFSSWYCGPWGCSYMGSRYGYYGSYWGGGYGWYGSPRVWVVPVNPNPDAGEVQRRGTVTGSGYSRGTRPAQGTARPRGSSGTTGTRSSVGSSGSSMGAGSSSGSSGGSGSGSVSSGGHSSGGSSSSGTAKPRGGGE